MHVNDLLLPPRPASTTAPAVDHRGAVERRSGLMLLRLLLRIAASRSKPLESNRGLSDDVSIGWFFFAAQACCTLDHVCPD